MLGKGSTLVWQFAKMDDHPPTHNKHTNYKELHCNQQSLPGCVSREIGGFMLKRWLHLLAICWAAVPTVQQMKRERCDPVTQCKITVLNV